MSAIILTLCIGGILAVIVYGVVSAQIEHEQREEARRARERLARELRRHEDDTP